MKRNGDADFVIKFFRITLLDVGTKILILAKNRTNAEKNATNGSGIRNLESKMSWKKWI